VRKILTEGERMAVQKISRVGVFANVRKKGVEAVARRLFGLLKDVDIVVESDLARLLGLDNGVSLEEFADLDLIITLGGDGTVLKTARILAKRQIPILGVNMGRLGFLTELLPDELDEAMPKILAGEFRIDRRMMIETFVEGITAEPVVGLNETTVDKAASPRTLHFTIKVSGEEVSHIAADGFIVATPTGSTAYSMAAGGAIVAPHLEVLLLTAIAPYTLSMRPLIVSGDDVVEISYQCRDTENPPHLTVDGQTRIQLGIDSVITVRRSEYKAKLVSYHRRSFYEVLKTKLGWGPPPPTR